MKISFLGAAREVTGSCYLLEAGGRRGLIDCGMFQGGREARGKNRAALAFDPRRIDFVLLTHAHIDHSGLLPRLAALGYRGPIHATPPTCDLLAVMLPDAAYIQEKEAERENRHRHRARHAPPANAAARPPHETVPLYTVAQAHDCLRRLRPVDYDTEFEPAPGLRCRLRDAGHILGSAIVELWVADGGRERKLVFSGDLGQPGRPIVRDPTPIAEADVLLIESTYGNRLHKGMAETEDELVRAIDETIGGQGGGGRRGNLIMPSFAVGRTQEVLYLLGDLMRRGRIARDIEIYVDSPMAVRATELTLQHLDETDIEMRDLTAWQKQKRANRPRIRYTESVEDSMQLNDVRGAIIISASGMCDAGRVKHHLRHNLPRPESGILITGFQAEGTLGRRLVDGATRVRIFGEEIAVRARLYTLGGLSAHADQAALLGWLGGFQKAPAHTFVVHGEAATAEGFAALVHERLGWRTRAPQPLETHSL